MLYYKSSCESLERKVPSPTQHCLLSDELKELLNLRYHEEDIGIPAKRHFFATRDHQMVLAKLQPVVLLRKLQLDHIRGRANCYSCDILSIEVPKILTPGR